MLSIQYLEENSKIPVPHIYYFENNAEKSLISSEFILMNRVKGVPLNFVIQEIYADKGFYKQILSQIADILSELRAKRFSLLGHFVNRQGFSVGGTIEYPGYVVKEGASLFSECATHSLSYYKQEMQRLYKEGHANKELFAKYLPILDSWLSEGNFLFLNHPKDEFVYSHQDLVMKNILVDQGKISAVLDWEWSGSALAEVEAKTGLDFLFTEEDRQLFNRLLEERGVFGFFAPPPPQRALFYQLMGKLYTLVACYEWREGKLEHTAKFLDQKLEQRKVRSNPNFDMREYLNDQVKELDLLVLEFNKWVL